MNEYNKKYTYRGYEFNITVTLNFTIQRGLEVYRCHRVRINCLGADNYYSINEVKEELLEEHIELKLSEVRQYVDKKLDPNYADESTKKAIDLLTSLGFE